MVAISRPYFQQYRITHYGNNPGKKTARKSTTYIPDSLRNPEKFKPNLKVLNLHHLDISSQADQSNPTQSNAGDATPEDEVEDEDNQEKDVGQSN